MDASVSLPDGGDADEPDAGGPDDDDDDAGPAGDDDASMPDEDGGLPSGETDFFSSFEADDPQPTWLNTVEVDADDMPRTEGLAGTMKTELGIGPSTASNAKTVAGFTGLKALRYEGSVTATGRGYAFNKVFDVDLAVVASSELSYLVFPDEVFSASDPHYLKQPSTYVAVDLAFDDGSYLSEREAARDQHFARATPEAQGASRTLYSGEWNRKAVKLGELAAGRRIKRILVGYDQPAGPVNAFGGYIDDLRIRAGEESVPARLSEYVVTTRGSNSGSSYARGNCIPAVATPHGFSMWAPVTNSSEMHWTYTYQHDNNADNLPTIEGFRVTHLPSPWTGDRAAYQVMPVAAGVEYPSRARDKRALPFRHENEIAQPHYYSVTFENGIRVEITPTDHAAMMRFTFPTREATLLFDHVLGEGGNNTLLHSSRALIAGALNASPTAESAGASSMYLRAEFDKPISEARLLSSQYGYYRFDLPEDDYTVTMRMTVSLLSRVQAEKNLDLELADSDTFEDVKERAQRMWDDKLGLIKVEGANRDQLTTLYSNLYRLFLYPSSASENTGTNGSPNIQYASPFQPQVPNGMSDLTTTAVVTSGQLYVNNGFWDTYRATWPALALFTPTQTGKLVDGFVQHYRDGGWISRWSAPGYADLMTGTSSDVAFADALLKGVDNFDTTSAYAAALRNATVVPPESRVGRKSLHTALYRGYTATDIAEGFSWAMAGYLNDFGVASMAQKLAQTAAEPLKTRYLEEAEYFRKRSQGYVQLFDAQAGFFQGRNPDGTFRVPAVSYDPEIWGNDYTETNGWNMAFEPTHDGRGLANLYGGRSGLAAKLDEFFATPEAASDAKRGSYGFVIHEMREARDVRMGQLGLSNQASFHIPYMYLFAGQPEKTQAKVRDALARLWVGSEIGQGYLGDDDNGSLSAWQIFSSLGFYPLRVGSATYVIGSPLYAKATVKLENGKSIIVKANNNSPENVYVQSLKVNGVAYTKTYLTHDQLMAGVTLEFEMGPAPSTWGTAAADAPPSLTVDDAVPTAFTDAARAGSCTPKDNNDATPGNFIDDSGASADTLTGTNTNPWFQCALAASSRVTFYTLTSVVATGSDPASWTLLGSNDGADWDVLDERSGESFAWRQQARPFKVATPGDYTYYRIQFNDTTAVALAEVELLTP